MKKLLIILSLSIFFTGCMSVEKATGYLQKKGRLDDVCAAAFPVKDSAGSTVIEIVKPADNKDYSGSLKELNEKMQDLNQAWESVLDSSTGAVSSFYQRELLKLQKQISSLKENIQALNNDYKPCKPDTAFVTTKVYLRDRAFEKVQSDSIQKLSLQKLQLEASNKKLRKGLIIISIIAGALIALITIKIVKR